MSSIARALLCLATLFSGAPLAFAAPSPDRVLSGGARALSALRLLNDRAPYLEYPAHGAFGLIGSQGGPVEVDVAGGGSMRLARTSLEAGFGWRNLKFGIFWDGVKLGGDTNLLFGGFTSGSSLEGSEYGVVNNFIPSVSLSLAPELALTAGLLINNERLRSGVERTNALSPLVRARLLFFDLESGFPEDPESSKLALGTLEAGLGLVKLGTTLGALFSESSRSFWLDLARVVGEVRTFSSFYAAGSNPFILDLASGNVAETDLGLEWRSGMRFPFLAAARVSQAVTGDPGFRRAELEMDLSWTVWDRRIAGCATPSSYWKSMLFWTPFTSFVDGIGSPGVTLVGLSARGFLVRLDDEIHPGFSAGLRVETFTDHVREEDKDEDSEYLWYEGEEQAFVRSYLELRASMNDTFSPAGLPYPDALGVGLFYVVENLEQPPSHDPVVGERAERLERLLDGNRDFRARKETRETSLESRVIEGVVRGVLPGEPKSAGDDSDEDGVSDEMDRCPDQPEDRDGYLDEDGCPDEDNDGDGARDAVDACPTEPGPNDGCP
ncbi:MAG: thrombospondin type 3 repeat-containing protein [Deltaproteobacteria bacterium]|nr:thrombospondin type 3 repeat-containing protein [Deltaproteobacteria bacterium]